MVGFRHDDVETYSGGVERSNSINQRSKVVAWPRPLTQCLQRFFVNFDDDYRL